MENYESDGGRMLFAGIYASDIAEEFGTPVYVTDEQKLRENYYNKALEELVLAKNEDQKTIDYKGEMIRKLEPVFMDPSAPFVRAHFYAPRKQVFGVFTGTFAVNVVVIWFMTAILYLALYFRVLKRILDMVGTLTGKKTKMID